MGQQQLLLLVLGIVIVGLAVAVGISAFEENQRKARRDAAMERIVDVAAKIQAWKMKPAALGGSEYPNENDFRDFTPHAIGLTPGSDDRHDTHEYVWFDDVVCLRIWPTATYIEVRALDTECTAFTPWMWLRITGTDGQNDMEFTFNAERAMQSGY
ncbi:MAG: hypothetical protein AAGG50_11750 [Bacteroidota bacterium]